MTRRRRGRSEGSIYQRADGMWAASISLGYDARGKRKRRTIYGKSKGEVQEKLRQLQAAASSGRIPAAGEMLIKHFLAIWLDAVKPHLADYTHRDYRRHVDRYLTPHLGGVRLVQMTPLHVQRFYADLAKAGVSPAMARKAGTTLSAALSYAVDPSRLIPHNPAREVRRPRHTPREMRPLDPDEVARFLSAAAGDRLYALCVLMLDSGARTGEALALTWADVDWDGRAVQILRNLQELDGVLSVKDLKTNKSRRRVALSAFTMEALGEHRKAMLVEGLYRADGPIFVNTIGEHIRKNHFTYRSFRPALIRAGLPMMRPYDLRHSAATLLLLAGEPTKVVSERLGHSTTHVTQETYQHVLPGMQEKAAAKMDAIFRHRPPPSASV